MLINIITRCTRVGNIEQVKNSIFQKSKFDVKWWLIFDTRDLKEIDASILESLQNVNCQTLFYEGDEGDFGHQLINKAIDKIEDGFVYIIDDDNIIHDDFYEEVYNSMKKNPDKRGFVFSQKVGGKDFTGLDIRQCSPDNMKVQKIDMSQFVIKIDLIGNNRFDSMNYIADGVFIEKLFLDNPDDFIFIDKILCHYNYIVPKKWESSPRVLYIGEGEPDLRSISYPNLGETDKLIVKYQKDDSKIESILNEFNPNSIIVVGDLSKSTKILNQPPDIRRRSYHLPNLSSDIGEISYQVSMNWILNLDRKDTVSYFTPIYNTGDKLKLTYKSLVNQTINNWEWVIVNDSTDDGKTLKIAEEISSNDNRVKLYDFRKKSGGVIGESKYRAAMMCGGDILAELDHDDFLMPKCTEMLLKASEKFPESGFFYTDSAEMTSDWNSPRFYDDGFGLGYGKYREENHFGVNINIIESPNINPKTIRHIVGVPNHVRAWRRREYMKIGGHNRNLTIADDFELLIRTFLETNMVKIPSLGYLQFIHNTGSNTHNISRADIQRRVRTIGSYYNQKIFNRFEDLGLTDWAYLENKEYPLSSKSRFDDQEEIANSIFYYDQKVNKKESDIDYII